MDHLVEELAAGVAAWDDRGWPRPQVALVSGSGLAVDLGLTVLAACPLQDVLPWSASGIAGHPMRLEVLRAGEGGPVVAYFQGRLHCYQGYSAAQAAFPVRLAGLLGAGTLLMTNASGGIAPQLAPGSLVLLTDHLNLSGLNPLCGEPPAAWGPRFPDMADAYDPAVRRLFARHAERLGIVLHEGVYAGVAGPSYETPAEVRMLRSLGADVVGMSTVVEVIAARHLGLRCGVVSVASNPAAGLSPAPLTHEEVLAAGREAAAELQQLLRAVLLDPRLVA